MTTAEVSRDTVSKSEEPDAVVPHVRFGEGRRDQFIMAEIMWHRGETTRQTEKTNISLKWRDLRLLDTLRRSRQLLR
jgi:hypothetical protein